MEADLVAPSSPEWAFLARAWERSVRIPRRLS